MASFWPFCMNVSRHIVCPLLYRLRVFLLLFFFCIYLLQYSFHELYPCIFVLFKVMVFFFKNSSDHVESPLLSAIFYVYNFSVIFKSMFFSSVCWLSPFYLSCVSYNVSVSLCSFQFHWIYKKVLFLQLLHWVLQAHNLYLFNVLPSFSFTEFLYFYFIIFLHRRDFFLCVLSHFCCFHLHTLFYLSIYSVPTVYGYLLFCNPEIYRRKRRQRAMPSKSQNPKRLCFSITRFLLIWLLNISPLSSLNQT